MAPLRQLPWPQLAAGAVPPIRYISLNPMFGPLTSYAVTRGIHVLVSARLQPASSSMRVLPTRALPSGGSGSSDPVAEAAAAAGDAGAAAVSAAAEYDEAEVDALGFVDDDTSFLYAYRIFIWGDPDAAGGAPGPSPPIAQLERRRWVIRRAGDAPGAPPEEVR